MPTPKQTLYPFAEMLEITTNGTTSVDIWVIPAGTIITRVLAKIRVIGVGTGNLRIGDDDTNDGFILAKDATAAVDTVYGDDVADLGAYLDSGTNAGMWKLYASSGKEIKIDVDASTLTTEATIDVFIFGYRYSEN